MNLFRHRDTSPDGRNRPQRFATSRTGMAALALAVGAAATAAWVQARARRAERDHPPTGQFIDIDGGHLHYVASGEGPPVVLLHGNNAMLTDFSGCALLARLAKNHRVIAFDRPGFGHSTRPRDRLWTPQAQAALLHAALQRLGVQQPVLVGHSMGTLVALAMALDHPADVRSLVLIGGYYYPTARIDALLTAPVALPVIGDVTRYTVTALAARAMLKAMVKAMFAPDEVAPGFVAALPREMLLRPSQLRADAEDAAFMVPAARKLSQRYGELKLPLTLIAGTEDQVVDEQAHSTRLHSALPQSELLIVPEAGHMTHYVAQDTIVKAIDWPLHALASEHPAASADNAAPQAQPAAARP